MRSRLMKATVECLAERGYAAFSISDVARRAGVTRGALFHHFATRVELIAEAVYWHQKAIWTVDRECLLAAIAAGASLEEQLRLAWSQYRKRAAIDIEFMTATRADRELASEWEAAHARNEHVEPRYNSTPVAWATAPGDPTPDLSRFVVGYFLTGMQALAPINTPEVQEETLAKFASILELAFAAMKRAQTGGGE